MQKKQQQQQQKMVKSSSDNKLKKIEKLYIFHFKWKHISVYTPF